MIGFDVKIAGDALLTEGLEGYDTVDGIALVTFGFLFDCASIWVSSLLPITTSWASADSSITTTWTDLDGSGGIYGDC